MAVTAAVPADVMGGRHSYGTRQLAAGIALVLLEA
jgi:hypothetical protein